jgi:hypothetical protein
VPPPRLGTSRDVASAVRFFLSAEAEWITSADLVVDGGYLVFLKSSDPLSNSSTSSSEEVIEQDLRRRQTIRDGLLVETIP